MSVVRRVGIVAAVMVLATLGGGSKGSKNRLSLAQQESAGLREQNASLEAQLGEKNNKIAELEGRLAATPPPQQFYGNEPPVTRYPGNNGGGSTGSSFTRGRDGTSRATVSGDVLFDSGQVVVKTGAKRELDQIAGEIKRTYSRAEVQVEGYTDSDPIRKSKWGTNERLSQERAEAVRRYLVSKGVPESRINAVGMGSASPKSSKAASRRVEVVILQ